MEGPSSFQINFSDKKQTLLLTVMVQAVLCIPFSICAFVVANTSNAGFNIVLTALINSGFAAGGYNVIQGNRTSFSVGIIIGCSLVITSLSLMTAIYWGQLSKCEVVTASISQYTCNNKVAYAAVSVFATLLFLSQVIFTGSLIGWMNDIIESKENQNNTLESTSLNTRRVDTIDII
jgi:hypothetical protein